MTPDDPWDSTFRFSTRFGMRLLLHRIAACVVLAVAITAVALIVCMVLSLWQLGTDSVFHLLPAGFLPGAGFILGHSVSMRAGEGVLEKRVRLLGVPVLTRRFSCDGIEVDFRQPPDASDGSYRIHAVSGGRKTGVLGAIGTFLNDFTSGRSFWDC